MTSTKIRIVSGVATVIVVILTIAWMMLDTLTLGADKEWPPKPDSEIIMDDEYAEIIDLPKPKSPRRADPSPAQSEHIEQNQSTAAPQTGMETVDQGTPGVAPEPVTQQEPSPVKVQKKEQQAPQGPSAEELRQQQLQEEARRKASSQTQNAFRNAGKNNTTSKGPIEGNSGRPTGSESSINGRGTGRVGGGWKLPAYSEVPSTLTGSVEMRVKINQSGHVVSVSFEGGDAPAATDPTVRAACEREVRRRTFTRPTADDAPTEATAYITYRFR